MSLISLSLNSASTDYNSRPITTTTNSNPGIRASRKTTKFISRPFHWTVRVAFSPCTFCFSPCLSTSDHPPPDRILFSPFRRYVKHATLIEKCYPTERISNPTPKSNELSYLVYYAQSKPAKLFKVGSYMEKRIHRDILRRKSNDIKIDLAIFDALIASCSRDLSYFIRNLAFSLRMSLLLRTWTLFGWLAIHLPCFVCITMGRL